MRKTVKVGRGGWRLAVGSFGIAVLWGIAFGGCGGGGGAGNRNDAGPRGGNGAGTGGGTGAGGTRADGGARGGAGGSAKTDGSAPRDAQVATCVGDACPACGLAGLPCCENKCADPSLVCNEQTYFCTRCGGPGQPCCSTNPTCADSRLCQNGEFLRCTCTGDAGAGACSQCGAPGQLCCSSGSACSPGAICAASDFNQYCAACGGPGQPCCDGNMCATNGCCFLGSCVAAGEACEIPNGGYGTCSGGSCGCGRLGQPCCPTTNSDTATSQGKCSDPTTLCQLSGSRVMCLHCGDPGEPCCGGACNGTAVCDNATGITPMCEACGVTGSGCCAGHKCNTTTDCCSKDGNVIMNGTVFPGRCVASGAGCLDPNSGGGGVCTRGTCQCGYANEPCCGNPPQTCTAALTCSPTAGCTM